VLDRISGGDGFEEAASIPKRVQSAKKERIALAAASRRYSMAHEFGVRHKHEHMKKIAALSEVAELFGVSADTVDSAWKKHRLEVLRMIQWELGRLR
jgi:hypothetical protein